MNRIIPTPALDKGTFDSDSILAAYDGAKRCYASLGVDTEMALATLASVPVSLHCWQGDDVAGFEMPDPSAGMGGCQVTGNYPGAARTPEELRSDLDKALSLIPGRHRINLHASYAQTGKNRVERNALAPDHFREWIEWAKARGIGMDFNPTFYAHPKAADGFTLTHTEASIRRFWIDHGKACRRIAEAMGKALDSPCVTNVWIPDGFKDSPVDRKGARSRLTESLDEIFADRIDRRFNLDAVESKLFGIGSESCVIGSHEYYLGYAISRQILLCLDTGHFHPTENISDKISSTLAWVKEILLHVSRGVHWDSDHVVVLNDELRTLAEEIVWGEYLPRVHIGLDFFDASINRIAAWAIGTRNMIKALLFAMLQPIDQLKACEHAGDFTSRLALLEETKTMPSTAVWNYYCHKKGVPVGGQWMSEVRRYEETVLSKRTART